MNPERRLETMRRMLAHAHDILELGFGFVLWDGTTVPAGLAPDAFAIRIADEGAIAALCRRPNAETLANLWVSGRIDLLNGTLFDLVRLRPKVRTRDIRKTLDKSLLAKTWLSFLFVGRGGPWPLEAQPDEGPSDGSAAANRRNIGYHYDVSNAFYALWLDSDMVYSCGYCTDWTSDIDRMQQDKLEHICRKLRLRPGERLLDIGCGWGALCLYAARNYGVTTLGITLSEQQLAYAREKAQRLGLEDQARFALTDYAALKGRFDKVVSVGMQEHIGLRNLPTYCATVKRILKPGGIFLNHAITRPAKRNARTFRRKRPEFALLTRHIFPGGELDHIGNTLAELERHGFEVHDVEGLREHYQRTCKLWHDRLLARYKAATDEVGEEKTRLWLAYLAACSIAFERGGVSIHQTVATPRRQGASGLPPTRADLYRSA